jgi:hypothetical protein
MSFIVAGCALLVAVLASILLDFPDVEGQQERSDCFDHRERRATQAVPGALLPDAEAGGRKVFL